MFFLIFHVSICSFSTSNKTQNIAGRSRELHWVVQRAATPSSIRFHSELCDLGQGMVLLWASVASLKNGGNGRAFSWMCGEEGLTALSLPSPSCPQPSATSLVLGFPRCRLYLLEKETKAEGIDVHSSCSMTSARHSADSKMMPSHQQHRALGAPALDPAKHSLPPATVPDLQWVDSGSNPGWARTGSVP